MEFLQIRHKHSLGLLNEPVFDFGGQRSKVKTTFLVVVWTDTDRNDIHWCSHLEFIIQTHVVFFLSAIIMTTSLLLLQASRSEQRYTRSSRQSFRCASCGAAAAQRAANRSATRSSTRSSPPCHTSWRLPCATASYSTPPTHRMAEEE